MTNSGIFLLKSKRMVKSMGLTLLELLLGLSIALILVCFSGSYLHTIFNKNKLQVIAREIKSAVQYAKAQALLTGDDLALTPMSADRDWSNGMILFVDNDKHQYMPDSKILYEWSWPRSRVQVSWHGFQSQVFLLFSPTLSRSTLNGSFMLKDSNDESIEIVINRLGRVTVKEVV